MYRDYPDHMITPDHVPVPCASCELEIAAGAVPGAAVDSAVWALTLKDCCHGHRRQSHLVCHHHFLELVCQPFPGACPSCGWVSDSIADVVDTVMSLGAGEMSTGTDVASQIDKFLEGPEGGSDTNGLHP